MTVKGPLCKGRTVIESDNTYLIEIAPMADTEPLVRHAILSLSVTYVRDYMHDVGLEAAAAYHHKQAVTLLGKELRKKGNYDIEKGDAVVAALMLLSRNEVGPGAPNSISALNNGLTRHDRS